MTPSSQTSTLARSRLKLGGDTFDIFTSLDGRIGFRLDNGTSAAGTVLEAAEVRRLVAALLVVAETSSDERE